MMNLVSGDQVVPPEWLNPATVGSYQNYPPKAIQRGEYGIVSILLHVSVDGRVTGCDITETSGSEALDTGTCALFGRRARFTPAKDVAGAPIQGEYREAIAWGIEKKQPRTGLELSLLVPSLPPGYRSPAKARLLFDGTGKLMSCAMMVTSGNVAADQAVCAQMKRQPVSIAAPRSVAVGVSPVAVRYLTAAFFTEEAAKPQRR